MHQPKPSLRDTCRAISLRFFLFLWCPDSWPVPPNRFGELMGTCSHIPNTLWRVVANVLYTGSPEFAKFVDFSSRSSQSSQLSEHVPDSIYFVAMLFFIGGLTAVYPQHSGWMNGGARNDIQLPVLLGMRNHLYMTIIQHRVAIFVPQLSTCCHMHSPVTGVCYVPRILTGMFLEFSVSFPSSKVDLPCSHAPELLVGWPEKSYQSEWMTHRLFLVLDDKPSVNEDHPRRVLWDWIHEPSDMCSAVLWDRRQVSKMNLTHKLVAAWMSI
jgi:hypothetical protein